MGVLSVVLNGAGWLRGAMAKDGDYRIAGARYYLAVEDTIC